MEFTDEADRLDPTRLLEVFEKHCLGEINEVYERYLFNRRQQEPGETFDSFVGDLRRLYEAVEESAICDRIMLGVAYVTTRRVKTITEAETGPGQSHRHLPIL